MLPVSDLQLTVMLNDAERLENIKHNTCGYSRAYCSLRKTTLEMILDQQQNGRLNCIWNVFAVNEYNTIAYDTIVLRALKSFSHFVHPSLPHVTKNKLSRKN